MENKRTGAGFLTSCRLRGIRARVSSWGRVVLLGHPRVVDQARRILRTSPELEAAVLLELAEWDKALLDLLEERAAILWADGLPDSPLDAALSLLTPSHPEDTFS